MRMDGRLDRLLPGRPRPHGAEGVTILSWCFPVQLHLLSGRERAVAGDAHVTEVSPAATWGLGRVNDPPAILISPEPNDARCRHTSSLITGRLGYVRATSVNPAARNMAMVPVKMAAPPTRAALRAATSTGCPSTAIAPCSRANSAAAVSSAEPTPDRRWWLTTAKHVTHQTPGSSVSTFASARLPLTRGKSERGPTLVHPTG